MTENMTTKPTPSERRREAMGAIMDELTVDGHLDVESIVDPAALAAHIRETLLPLGRTARWQFRVNQWADMIVEPTLDHDLTLDEFDSKLRWGILQGAIWTGFEA